MYYLYHNYYYALLTELLKAMGMQYYKDFVIHNGLQDYIKKLYYHDY